MNTCTAHDLSTARFGVGVAKNTELHVPDIGLETVKKCLNFLEKTGPTMPKIT